MYLKELFDKNNIHYKLRLSRKNICVLEFDNETMLVFIKNNKKG